MFSQYVPCTKITIIGNIYICPNFSYIQISDCWLHILLPLPSGSQTEQWKKHNPFKDDILIQSFIHYRLSIATFDYPRVNHPNIRFLLIYIYYVLYYIMLYYHILYHIILYYIILFYIILNNIILNIYYV